MSKAEEKIGEGISIIELDAVRKRVKLGDKIRIRMVKANSDNISASRDGVVKIGTVIAKYPYFALLEFPGGIRETVKWLDLLLEKKNGKRKGGGKS